MVPVQPCEARQDKTTSKTRPDPRRVGGLAGWQTMQAGTDELIVESMRVESLWGRMNVVSRMEDG